MGYERQEDNLWDIEEKCNMLNRGRARTKNNGRTPSNQENGNMLRSKRRGGCPMPDKVNDRAQGRKDQDEEENPAKDNVSLHGQRKEAAQRTAERRPCAR